MGSDALPEWYLGASKTFLLPDNGQNFGSNDSADGSVLTISFHVKEEKVIKVYLYHQGKCIRLAMNDVMTVLPPLFYMEHDENQDCLKSKEVKDTIQVMQG